MYTIYVDGKLLHTPHLIRDGCGVFSPKLTVELNKAGSLEYTMPPGHVLYDDVQKLKSIVTVIQNGVELFRGRVLHDEKDFYKQKKVYCEGDLAYLLDSTQRPYTYDGTVEGLVEQYISNHNARVDADKRFTVGNVSLTGKIACSSSSYSSTFDEIQQQIIDNLGGYLTTRLTNNTRYLDLVASTSPEDAQATIAQTIEFGINLLDLSEHITAENVFTVLIPLGARLEKEEGEEDALDEYLTVESVNSGKDYIENSTAISLFGRIEKKQEWSEIEDASELLEVGRSYLNTNIEQAVSLTIRAVDLHLLDVNTDAIRLGEWVRVISLPHGLDRAFQCRKIVYDFENPENNEYSFGVDFTTLTDQQVASEKNMKSSVAKVVSAAGNANTTINKTNQIVQNIQTVISTLPTDYVSRDTFNDLADDVEALETEVSGIPGGYATKQEVNDLAADVEAVQGDVSTLKTTVSKIPNTYATKTALNALAGDVPFAFGIDQNGNYGYIKEGADTVTPFKTGSGDIDALIDGSITEVTTNATSIRMYAFSGCVNLTTVDMPLVTSIGDNAFNSCNKLVLTELPSGLTSINSAAFAYCSNLALTELPAGVTDIGSSAFVYCRKLALPELPAGVTSIGDSAFYGCTSLALTELPAGVTSIGNRAFRDCTGLSTITFKGTPTTIGSSAFTGCTNLTTINVPWAEGEVANAPWGATNATINYNYS